jgi:Snf7
MGSLFSQPARGTSPLLLSAEANKPSAAPPVTFEQRLLRMFGVGPKAAPPSAAALLVQPETRAQLLARISRQIRILRNKRDMTYANRKSYKREYDLYKQRDEETAAAGMMQIIKRLYAYESSILGVIGQLENLRCSTEQCEVNEMLVNSFKETEQIIKQSLQGNMQSESSMEIADRFRRIMEQSADQNELVEEMQETMSDAFAGPAIADDELLAEAEDVIYEDLPAEEPVPPKVWKPETNDAISSSSSGAVTGALRVLLQRAPTPGSSHRSNRALSTLLTE